MSIRRTIAHNTLFNAAGRAWELLAGLILLRIVVEYAGIGALGLWALVAPFIGYIALLDFGIGSGFAKYVAEHAARDEDVQLSAVVSTGFGYYLALGAACIALGWPVLGWAVDGVSRYVAIAEGTQGDLLFLLRGGLVLFALSNCIAPFTAIQTGLQRMGITNALGFAASLVKLGVAIALLEWGVGVRGLLIAEVASTLVFGIGSVTAAFILRPSLRISPRRMSNRTFGRLFSFGWRSQVARLSNLVMFQTDKAVAGMYFAYFGAPGQAAAQIGLYELGVNLANKVRQGPAVLTSALLPAAAHLDARDARDRLRELYLRSSKYLALVAVPLAVFTAASADLMLRAWMGEGFERSAWVLRIIVVGYVANIVPGAGVSIALGQGRADWVMMAGIVSMTANILLTVALVLTIGFWGIPIATACSMLMSWIWFAQRLRHTLGLGFNDLFRRVLVWPTIASLPGIVPCLLLDSYGAHHPTFLPSLAILGAAVLAFGALYAAAVRVLPCIDARDVALLESTLPLERAPWIRSWIRRAARV